MKGWDLDQISVWACGIDHGYVVVDPALGTIFCPCGIPTIKYGEWKKNKESDNGKKEE